MFPLQEKHKKLMKNGFGDPRQPRETAAVSPGGLAREGNLDNLGLIRYIALVADLVGLVD